MNLHSVDYLSGQKRRELEEEAVALRETLRNIKTSEYATERAINPFPIMKKLRRVEDLLKAKSTPEVSEREKTSLYKRAKELEKSIKQGMPTYDEMMGKRHSHVDNPNSKYQEAEPSAVRKNILWTQAKEKEVREWKNIMRILEPDDPGAANVERLRPRRGKIAKGGIDEKKH